MRTAEEENEVTDEDWNTIRMALELVPAPEPDHPDDAVFDREVEELYAKLRRLNLI